MTENERRRLVRRAYVEHGLSFRDIAESFGIRQAMIMRFHDDAFRAGDVWDDARKLVLKAAELGRLHPKPKRPVFPL